MYNFTDEQIAKAIKGSGGLMATIAKRLKCNWNTAQKYATSKPEFEEMLQEEKEAVLDMAEGALISQVKAQEAWAVKYMLSTLGKKRGYIERQDIDISSGGKPFSLKDLLTFEE